LLLVSSNSSLVLASSLDWAAMMGEKTSCQPYSRGSTRGWFGAKFKGNVCFGLFAGDSLVNAEGTGGIDLKLFSIHIRDVATASANLGVDTSSRASTIGNVKFLGRNLIHIENNKLATSNVASSTPVPSKIIKQVSAMLTAGVADNFSKLDQWSDFKYARGCPDNAAAPEVVAGVYLITHPQCALFVDHQDIKDALADKYHPSRELLAQIATHYGQGKVTSWSSKQSVQALEVSVAKVAQSEASNNNSFTALAPLKLISERYPFIKKTPSAGMTFWIVIVPIKIKVAGSVDTGLSMSLALEHGSGQLQVNDNLTIPFDVPFDKPQMSFVPYADAGGYFSASINLWIAGGGVRGSLSLIRDEFKPTVQASMFLASEMQVAVNNKLSLLSGRVDGHVWYHTISWRRACWGWWKWRICISYPVFVRRTQHFNIFRYGGIKSNARLLETTLSL
jgi:hypothetical protein